MYRLSEMLYKKYCNQPYFPEGEIFAKVTIGNPKCLGWDGRENHITIDFRPKKFIPAVKTLFINQKFIAIKQL